MKKIIQRSLLVVLFIALSFGGGFSAYMLSAKMSTEATPKAEIETVQTSTKTNSTDLSEVVDKASQSVVEISTETRQRGYYNRSYVSEGAGSGVIIREDGYIITNNHVIDGANRITVRTKDGNEYDAEVVKSNSRKDLAILKIEVDKKDNLSAAKFADSDKLVVGQNVIAIGNPLGELGGTVTRGILSSTSREIEIDNSTMTLLQTDAAINPGNSGGGLFDEQGNLIGIVNAKSSGSDVEGLGFAIPANVAVEYAKSVIDEN